MRGDEIFAPEPLNPPRLETELRKLLKLVPFPRHKPINETVPGNGTGLKQELIGHLDFGKLSG